jgi:2-keto-4-pentenoate hydratase/2-oxohepta-3-ene-1,7-dioic acid hydratase in catechol pathway
MRIIRFVDADGLTHTGEDHADGAASVLVDPLGVLGVSPLDRRVIYQGKRALVADDDENMRQMMSTVLGRLGCICTICSDGAEAMAAIESEPLDLIVTDIVMPHHNGYELFAAAKKKRAELPIVLVTGFGYDPTHSLVRASQEGLAAVLYKPFTPQDLLGELEKAMRAAAPDPARTLRRTGERLSIEHVLAPIEPSNIICIGSDPSEGRGESDEEGLVDVFMKPNASIQRDGGAIRTPDAEGRDPHMDCEGELAVVIGYTTQSVSEEEALDGVLGYTIANDVTARHWESVDTPRAWMRGKGFDTFCPMGPSIVSRDEIADPDELVIRTLINGEVVRRGAAGELRRSVRQVISELSKNMTLDPGTVVLTGAPPLTNPSGGAPPLQPGDEVAVEIDGIGRLTNFIAATS